MDDHIDSEDRELADDLAALATVQAAVREIDRACSALAGAPLSEATADRMRAVLASPELRRARRALRHLEDKPVRRPFLTVVREGAAVAGGVA